MDCSSLRQEYEEAARRMIRTGLQTGVGGNLSIRVPDGSGMLIKSSGRPMADPVVVDWQGGVLSGEGGPSSEFLMHSAIYRLRPDCGGIVHAHSNWSVSWSLTGRDIPQVSFTARLKLKAPVPVIAVPHLHVEADDIRLLEPHLADRNVRAFILRGHGLVTLGRTLMDAVYHAELIEECAQVAWNALMLRGINALPEDFETFHGVSL